VIKKWITSYRVSIVLALLTLISAVLGLATTLAELVIRSNQILFGASLILFILAEAIQIKEADNQWTGFARLPLLVVWLVMGIESAVALVVLGSIIAVILRMRFNTGNGSSLNEGIYYIANSGASILATQAIYILLKGDFSIAQSDNFYYNLSITLPALLAGSASSLLVHLIVSPETTRIVPNLIVRDILSEIMILFMALILPLVFSDIGWLPFWGIIVLVAGQNVRQVQVEQTQIELKQRVLEVSTLSSFGHAVTTQISLPGVLELVHRELNRVINATTFFIALYDDDQDTLDYPFVIQNGKPIVWQKQKLGHGLVDYVIQQKKALLVNKQEMQSLAKTIERQQISDACYMIAPLIVGMKIIGAIGMSHASDSEAFATTDFDLLETIASQTSLAIRNANLYDRTVRLADNLSVINQSLQDVMFNLDRNDALRTACQIARNVTRAQKAAIFLLQPHRSQQMVLMESVGFENMNFSNNIVCDPKFFQNGARVVVNIEETSFEDVQKHAQLGGFQACLQVPLRSGHTVVGIITVYHDEPYYYETPELNLLEMLANQITAALDNAELLQALELYAAEQAQLVHLSRISGVSLDLERIIRDVSEMLAQMIDMDSISIGIYHPEREVLRLESPDDDGLLRVREVLVTDIPEMKSLLAPHAFTNLNIFYAKRDTYSDGLKQFLEKNHYETLALLPMQINQKSIGLIMMADYEHHNFSDNDNRLLEMAAHQISAQIHNARLHTQTEEALVQRLEQLDLIEEISRQISQALDVDLIIQNVLEAALQSTHADFAAFAFLGNTELDTFEIIGREVVGDKLLPYHTTLKDSIGVSSYVVSTRKIILIEDNQSSEIYLIPPNTHTTFRSSLAVPLVKGENVVGVLDLESQQPNFFTMEQASFIKSLAGHAVISIDNASLLKEREQQINILTRLREMALDSLSILESDKMAIAILHTALLIFDGQEGVFYRYNAADDNLTLVYGARIVDGRIEKASVVFPQAVALKAAKTIQPIIIGDVNELASYQGFEKKEDIHHCSLVAIPIVRRQQVQEMLCISFSEAHRLNDDDFGTINLLAVQAAGHLENAMLNEAITTSNDRMRAILDSTREGIILLDPDGVVQDANNAAGLLTGLALRDYLQESLASIIQEHGQNEVLQQIVTAYAQAPENVHEKEYTIEHDSNYLHIKTFVYRVQDDMGKTVGGLLVLRDITKQKDLQIFHDRMQGMVLHDLRGPLSSIITSMYMAVNIVAYPGDDPLEETLLPIVQISLDSANDLLQMVETLQELPTIAKMRVYPTQTQLNELAEKARKALTAIMADASITLDIEIAGSETVAVDEGLARRIFVNLLHNAVKFTPENGQILIRADHETEQEGYLRLLIADTGPGIPDVERERIFGEYVQIKEIKPRTGGKGLGLGLNFCKLATEAHGGRIWVEPEGPLSGACFAFTLPMSEEALQAALAQREK
jgi:PAS domain S-box-containing protein